MRVGARPAGPGDVEEMTRLLGSAIGEKSLQRGGGLWANSDAPDSPLGPTLLASIGDPDALIEVGTIDDVVFGFSASRLLTLHDRSRMCELHLIYVDPEARGVGVGESLLTNVIEWAESRDCVGIDSVALPGDRHTKNFFESFGLVARKITVHRRIGDNT